MTNGKPKTKRTEDYKVLKMTSTNTKVKCTRCSKLIENGQTYYYKIGDEMHTTCEDMVHNYPLKTK